MFSHQKMDLKVIFHIINNVLHLAPVYQRHYENVIKCSASLAFYHFSSTRLQNSIKHGHSCKISYLMEIEFTYSRIGSAQTCLLLSQIR